MNKMASSTDNKSSRYVQGGLTDLYEKRLGWWDRYTFTKDDTDMVVTLDSKYHQRPDLLAYDMYGSSNYEWLVLQYNNILDIITEFVVGKEIRLPTKSRADRDFLVSQTGGNRVK